MPWPQPQPASVSHSLSLTAQQPCCSAAGAVAAAVWHVLCTLASCKMCIQMCMACSALPPRRVLPGARAARRGAAALVAPGGVPLRHALTPGLRAQGGAVSEGCLAGCWLQGRMPNRHHMSWSESGSWPASITHSSASKLDADNQMSHTRAPGVVLVCTARMVLPPVTCGGALATAATTNDLFPNHHICTAGALVTASTTRQYVHGE